MLNKKQTASLKWLSSHKPSDLNSGLEAKKKFLAYMENGEKRFTEKNWNDLNRVLNEAVGALKGYANPLMDISSFIQDALFSAFGRKIEVSEMIAYFMNVNSIPFSYNGQKSYV